MTSLILFLAVLFGAAGIVFYTASEMAIHGTAWAIDVCSVGRAFCDNPQITAIAEAALIGLWVVAKLVSALRD